MDSETHDPPATGSGASAQDNSGGLSLRCWGTRGSVPSPGPGTAGYGGNTSCLSVRVEDRSFIFDAGTGIRLLGDHLNETSEPVEGTIFLTHFHWDHIQGFPFFAPLYAPDTSLRIVGPRQEETDIKTLFAGQMGPVYFPIPFEAVGAELTFAHMNEDQWMEDGVTISSMRVRHPSFTVGYRLDAPSGSVCYVPDNELEGEMYPTKEGWRSRFVEFLEGADVLFHDAMYTEEEYRQRVGWGHSTYDQTLDLAAEAGVGQLYFFHHAPGRTDAGLNPILERLRTRAADRGLEMGVNMAFEGKVVHVEED